MLYPSQIRQKKERAKKKKIKQKKLLERNIEIAIRYHISKLNSCTALAKEYGISKQRIYDLYRLNKKHLPIDK